MKVFGHCLFLLSIVRSKLYHLIIILFSRIKIFTNIIPANNWPILAQVSNSSWYLNKNATLVLVSFRFTTEDGMIGGATLLAVKYHSPNDYHIQVRLHHHHVYDKRGHLQHSANLSFTLKFTVKITCLSLLAGRDILWGSQSRRLYGPPREEQLSYRLRQLPGEKTVDSLLI